MQVEVCGYLKQLLDTWGASPDVARLLARRAGAIVPSTIKHNQIEAAIMASARNGIPDWNQVVDKVGEAAAAAYKGKRIKL